MLIFLYGEDTFRSRQKLKELKEKFLREVDPSGNSLNILDGENITLDKINETMGASSLFSKKRMIVVERIFSCKSKTIFEELKDYLIKKEPSSAKAVGDKKNQENIIIFWDDVSSEGMLKNKLFNFLNKQKYTQEFKKLSNTDIINWIKKEFQAKNGKIKQQASVLLSSLVGSDLWQLNNEINKLINYKKAQCLLDDKVCEAEIEKEDVEEFTRGKFDENIFAFTDAISNRNKAQALDLFEKEIEAGVADSYLLHMIIRQFRILMQVRQALDQGATSRKITSSLRLHPFVAQKASTQVRSFSLQVLKNIFSSLVEIDKKIKTGQSDFRTELSLLIAKI